METQPQPKTHNKSRKSIAVALILTVAAVITVTSLSTLRIAHATTDLVNIPIQDANAMVASANSGPFRDGVYQGKLAKERGSELHIGVGRWASKEDRAAFTVGYLQGYDQAPEDIHRDAAR